MKPKNFPGRKAARKARADARAAGQPMPESHDPTYVRDIKLRVGAARRDERGVPR